ncbi:hypothetical protein AAZX31_03G130000 [Glycine max]
MIVMDIKFSTPGSLSLYLFNCRIHIIINGLNLQQKKRSKLATWYLDLFPHLPQSNFRTYLCE